MKKLLNKRGSVLFLVVVVMALLVIAASATYYVIRNQHASANTHYASEQSYQVAYSVSDTMETYFTNLKKKISENPDAYSGSLFQKMMKMDPGDTLTSSNGLADYGLGDFDIEILKTTDSTDEEGIFEVKTHAVTNGESTTMTQVWKISMEPSETKYFTRFLTSTGNRKEDVYITATQIYGDTYFENPFTSAGLTYYQRPVYCAATLVDNGVQFPKDMVSNLSELEIVVAENYYIATASGGTMEFGELFVGGNAEDGYIDQDSNKPKNGRQLWVNNAFILGDFSMYGDNAKGNYFVQKDCYIDCTISNFEVNFYIDGDLHIGKNSGPCRLDNAIFHVNGDVYFYNGGSGDAKKIYYTGAVKEKGGMSDADINKVTEHVDSMSNEASLGTITGGRFTNWKSVDRYITTKTAKGTYNRWEAESYFNENLSGKIVNLDTADDPNYIQINDSCILRPATTWGWGNPHFIVIDASVKDIYIMLDPGPFGDTFMFGGYKYDNWDGTTVVDPAIDVQVLVKGSHSVIFILPEFVTVDGKICPTKFKISTRSFVGHLDVALAMTGYKSLEKLMEDRVALYNYFNTHAGAQKMNSIMDYKTLDEKDEITGEYKKIWTIDKNKSLFNVIEGTATPHNNIFLVANGKDSILDFSGGYSITSPFCGYIYAPNSLLQVTTMCSGLSFYGGLIVGSYNYMSYNGELIFSEPYDDYNGHGANIVTDLMATANSGTEIKIETESSFDIESELLGYK